MHDEGYPNNWHAAEKLWVKGHNSEARELFKVGVAESRNSPDSLGPAFFLAAWAYFESTIGNRGAFEDLFAQVFSLEPDAPLFRLSYVSTDQVQE